MKYKLMKIALFIGTLILFNACSLPQYTTAREAKQSAIRTMEYRKTLTFEELEKIDGKPPWIPIRYRYHTHHYIYYYWYY